jgi:hypothetical protein
VTPKTGRLVGVEPMAALAQYGMLLQSARGPVPSVAELVAGEPVRGSWWSHPASHEIFVAINALCASPDVVRVRLIDGKVTLVHRRLWPALVRVGDRFPSAALAAIHEEHSDTGAHTVRQEPFPAWVPNDVRELAASMSDDDAWEQLPEFLRVRR